MALHLLQLLKQPEQKKSTALMKVEESTTMNAGKCDICDYHDGWRGQNLQRCRECNVLVHERCYGLVPTDCKDDSFVCHACQSVETNIEVNVPSQVGGTDTVKVGKRHCFMKQEKRPTECVLCSHDTGLHAMHPLYDTHGKYGRQLVLHSGGHGDKRKEERLAWVHTLCASVICSNPKTAGCVYGCFEDGSYEDATVETESDDDDDSKEDMTSIKMRQTCFFAIAGKENGEETVWTKAIKSNCNELKCFICGDKKNWNYKIPLQCIAGDESEVNIYKKRHLDLNNFAGTECSVAMHVGCAKWGFREMTEGGHLEKAYGRKCRLCYFTPGYETYGENSLDVHGDVRGEVVAHCYCMAHARDIVVNDPKLRKSIAEASRNNQTSSICSEGRIVTPGRNASRGPNTMRLNSCSQERLLSSSIKKTHQNTPERRGMVSPGRNKRVRMSSNSSSGESRMYAQANQSRSPERRMSPPSLKSPPESLQRVRGSTFHSPGYSRAHARASPRKSLNTIRPRNSKRTLFPRERKFGAVEENAVFGRSVSRKRKHGDGPKTTHFPAKGKSANALAKK